METGAPPSLVDSLFLTYVALLGLIVGSYLNVVIYRLPRGLSTLMPRSRCPRCRSGIRPWENIPVLSYVLLAGRCRRCGVRISPRYPLVEILTSACFVWSFLEFKDIRPIEHSVLGTVVAWAFCAAMIALAFIDFDHFLLPDAITWPGIAIALLVLPRLGWITDKEAWLGAALGAGSLLFVAWGWYLWKRVHGMGMGDVKMLAMIGGALGWKGTVSTLFFASLGGSLVGIGLVLTRRLDMQSRMPFGVFLAIGALLSLFFRHDLGDFYQRTAYTLASLFFSGSS